MVSELYSLVLMKGTSSLKAAGLCEIRKESSANDRCARHEDGDHYMRP
jgi:hypothetical protein